MKIEKVKVKTIKVPEIKYKPDNNYVIIGDDKNQVIPNCPKKKSK